AEEYARLFGITVAYHSKVSKSELVRLDVKKAFEKPTVAIIGSRVAAWTGSKLSVEVLAVDQVTPRTQESDYKPLTARAEDGYAYVPLRRGQSYAVRLTNDSDADVAVTLAVDGMGLFSFTEEKDEKTGQPKRYRMMVPRKGKLLVRGWFINHKETDHFRVSEYGRGLKAVRGGSLTDSGTIRVPFAACWGTGKPAPPDEPKVAAPAPIKGTDPGVSAGVKDESVRGLRVPANFKTVPRTIGVTREI